MCTQVVYVEAVDVSADYLVIPPGERTISVLSFLGARELGAVL
jgi:hypothetical protein